ncbi:MAG TPA: OsmC family peroxiredoxin [Terriglobales bacterium]|jgi:osmotically inducible protein OsmC|nr:OsmC family peroxiredoxin [Terriglobales bacterium]
MPVRSASAQWQGNLTAGHGVLCFDAYQGAFSFRSRMEEGPGVNPEELLGAAHAGCFSMALAAALSQAGATPHTVTTRAQVHFGPSGDGYAISAIELVTEVEAGGMDEASFQKVAETAKETCPVSKALAATPIALRATLRQTGSELRAG